METKIMRALTISGKFLGRLLNVPFPRLFFTQCSLFLGCLNFDIECSLFPYIRAIIVFTKNSQHKPSETF